MLQIHGETKVFIQGNRLIPDSDQISQPTLALDMALPFLIAAFVIRVVTAAV